MVGQDIKNNDKKKETATRGKATNKKICKILDYYYRRSDAYKAIYDSFENSMKLILRQKIKETKNKKKEEKNKELTEEQVKEQVKNDILEYVSILVKKLPKIRGNHTSEDSIPISEVSKKFKISYPTLKKRVDKLFDVIIINEGKSHKKMYKLNINVINALVYYDFLESEFKKQGDYFNEIYELHKK